MGGGKLLHLSRRSLGEDINPGSEFEKLMSFFQGLFTTAKKENPTFFHIQIDRVKISLFYTVTSGHKLYPLVSESEPDHRFLYFLSKFCS